MPKYDECRDCEFAGHEEVCHDCEDGDLFEERIDELDFEDAA